MKPDTESFYENAVRKTISHICAHLDDVLDLRALSRTAALSPFHFHRVFRGMVGETPLELHRRLRMERAAVQLSNENQNVTRVALQAGYDTHESFTRAFRAHYAVPPSEFRQDPAASGSDCRRPLQTQLAADCGIHFIAGGPAGEFIPFTLKGANMDVHIKQMPNLRLGAVRHLGPYDRISEAFQRLGDIAGPAGLLGRPGSAMIATYYDDPETTPPDQLRADAAVVVSEGVPLPAGLTELRLPAGPYACTTHVGPYTELGDTWSRLMGRWLPQSGHLAGDGPSYEIYLNTPHDTPPWHLRTEIYLPLAAAGDLASDHTP